MSVHERGRSVNGEDIGGSSDPFNLERFVQAQNDVYDDVLIELRNGRKRSHWMWFIFPQIEGLGFSAISQLYSIKSLAEATAYLVHPILGPRLKECAETVLGVEGRSVHEIFGSPDDMKLKSSATLFAHVSPPGSVFHRTLDKYYGGVRDTRTLELLADQSTH